MKCPKCGYNSFEYLDQCKKCGNDLVSFKESNGIRSVLIPVAVNEVAVPAVALAPELPQDQPVADASEFSWDEPPAETAEPLPDFSFNEPSAHAEADLGELLESSVPLERTVGGQDRPPVGSSGGLDTATGEFELGDFLAEEKTQAPQPQPKPAPEQDGDFDFLFNSDEEKK